MLTNKRKHTNKRETNKRKRINEQTNANNFAYDNQIGSGFNCTCEDIKSCNFDRLFY